jgi:SAM-dependent methyltransferase
VACYSGRGGEQWNGTTWVEQQRQFYTARPHAHLQYSPQGVYAVHLTEHLLQAAKIQPGGRVLEVGSGAGRFTIPLLQRMQGTLTAFDLSETLLDQLRRNLESASPTIQGRCELKAGNIHRLDEIFEAQQFDAVIGFFFLHHLNDLTDAIRQLRRVLRPGGQMVFIEPNRRNPLFFLQVLCCPDMSWREEKGMFTLGRKRLRQAFRAGGMALPTIETFGCFPPQILDRWPRILSVEKRIERVALWKAILPFRLISSSPV